MRAYLRALGYLLSLHVLGLVVTGVLRLALFVAGHHFLGDGGFSAGGAFLRGVWFDNVVACYISIVPLCLLTLAHTFGKGQRGALVFSRWWMAVLWTLVILISCANIPYFLYFFKNINAGIWNWAEYGGTTLGMLLGEKAYYPPLLAFLALAALFIWLSGKLLPRKERRRQWSEWGALVVGLPLIGLCLLGIRGRRGYNPIKVSQAYYCDDAFLNQLGISPTFNLLTSSLDNLRPENKKLRLMDDEEALGNVRKLLERGGEGGKPLAYELKPQGEAQAEKLNVVLILMESMSRSLMGRGHTPFLDSLSTRSLFFDNCYSAGLHTNHGLYATLYSFPALMFRNMMKGSDIPLYNGLPTVLKGEGYRTMFFMTHESQYDNMNAFLRTNGYEEIYSQENYPRDKVVNSFGVQDDFLFSYAINRLKSQRQPFFATLLTISNHPPYVIPQSFHPSDCEEEWQIVEYADWSLRQFFTEAERQPWYGRTVFVLLGDHGKLIGGAESEMPECLNHIPLMFFVPGKEAERRSDWALQMDVQPTLLSLLGIEAEQNNFGVDLLSTRRPCAFYTADNVIGARSEGHLFVFNPTTEQEFLYLNGALQHEADSTFNALRQHVFSMLQAAQHIVSKGETQ
ncbi:MAG: LTA synthase family protein [Prevotellaceae bacterium]|nr:LTA synthase family protein [Prevotellaceae bacterium]